LSQRFDWAVHQAGDIELADDFSVAETLCDIADRGNINDEQDDVRDIELPDPFGQPRRSDDEAAVKHHSGVNEGGGIAGDENEEVGGVAEAVVTGGDPVHHIVRNVVQENSPVGNAAKQVEPKVAALVGQNGVDFHERLTCVAWRG